MTDGIDLEQKQREEARWRIMRVIDAGRRRRTPGTGGAGDQSQQRQNRQDSAGIPQRTTDHGVCFPSFF